MDLCILIQSIEETDNEIIKNELIDDILETIKT